MLERSEETVDLLTSTIEASWDGLLLIDELGRIAAANRRFVELWGVPAELMAAGDEEPLLEYTSAFVRDPAAYLARARTLREDHTAESCDVLELVDGRVFERYSHPRRSGGRVIGRVWSFRDVTAQRQAEQRLAEAQARYRVLVEQLPAATYVDDADGTPLYVSPQMSVLFGCTGEEWLADTNLWLSRVHPDEVDRVRAWYRDHLATGGDRITEYRIVHPDGDIRWIHDRVAAVRDETGRTVVTQGVMIDVSEARRAQSELAAAQQLYRALVEELPAVTYRYAADGRCLYVSPQVEQIFGCSRQEWIDGAWRRLVGSDDLARMCEAARRTRGDGVAARIEYQVQHPRLGTRWMEERLHIVQPPGEDAIVQGLITDVTEPRATEQALLESERQRDLVLASLLQAEVEERSRIATELHDDTVQELVAAQIAIDQALPFSTPPLTDRLQRIRDILTATTERTRRLMFSMRPQSLHAGGVGPAIATLGAQAAEEAGFEFTLEGSIPRQTEHVEVLLYRSLRELILNARTHARASRLTVRMEQHDGAITCVVEDDGVGFDPAQTRAPRPTSFHLGLHSAIERIGLAGGSLTVDSAPGRGTVAVIRLPAARPG